MDGFVLEILDDLNDEIYLDAVWSEFLEHTPLYL